MPPLYLLPTYAPNIADSIWSRANKSHLENIQELIRATFFELSCVAPPIHDIFRGIQGSKNFLSFTYDDLVNIATAIYLSKWLNCDPYAGKNLHDFAANGYEKQRNNDCRDVEAEYRKLFKASKKYRRLMAGHSEILYQEYPHLTRSHQDISPRTYGRLQHFKDLWMINAISGTDWNLFSLYFEYKRFLDVTSDKKPNTSLAQAYDEYFGLFSKIIPTSTNSQNFSETSDREYVVSSMMLYEMEYSSHFLFTAAVARYMEVNSIPPNFDKVGGKLKPFYTYIRDLDSYPSFAEQLGGTILPLRSFLIFPRNFKYKYIFEETISAQHYIDFYIVSMYLLRASFVKLLSVKPPWSLPSWTNEDFKFAREFYEKKFWKRAILGWFHSKLNSKGEIIGVELGNCYNNIRTIYDFINADKSDEKIPDISIREIVQKHLIQKPFKA